MDLNNQEGKIGISRELTKLAAKSRIPPSSIRTLPSALAYTRSADLLIKKRLRAQTHKVFTAGREFHPALKGQIYKL